MSQFLDSQHRNPKPGSNPLGLLIGLSNKGSSDYDYVRSPTSPFEFRVCSNMTEPFLRSPRSSATHNPHCLGLAKVGLGIVDSLHVSSSRDVVFGAAMRINSPKNLDNSSDFLQEPKSLPLGFPVLPVTDNIQKEASRVIFEIGENLYESEPLSSSRSWKPLSTSSSKPRALSFLNSSEELMDAKPESKSESFRPNTGFLGSLCKTDIEMSEDYTCVITHGPNPKTTHIYGDQVLEYCDNKEKHSLVQSGSVFPSDFLKLCYFCKRKLEGEDIYMYRGEKAFCSSDCRSEEMSMEENLIANESPRVKGIK